MIETPSLQTVLTLTGGTSPVARSVFVWGTPSGTFAVGTHGDWIINAAGVAPVHFFLRFDGKMLHLAGGPTGAPASISGKPVDQTWRPLTVFSVVSFGAAQLRVTCEPVAPRASSVPPVAPVVPVAAPHAQNPVPRLESTVPLGEVRRVRTEPIVLPEATQRTWAARSDPPPMVRDSGSHFPAAGPHPAATLVSATGAAATATATMSEVPSVRRELPPTGAELESTLSDSGALKEHAKRVASEPNLARASADAYLEAVRQQAGMHGSTPPPQVGDAGRPLAPGNFAGPSAMPRESTVPPAVAPPQVPTQVEDAPKPKDPKAGSSWVMRVTLVLLPFAAYFAIFWEPPAEAPPPAQVSAPTPTASAPLATASATSPASASPPPSGPAASGSAAPVATAVTPAPAPTDSSATSEASRPSPPMSVGSVANVAVVAVPTNANRPRDALNAAFEGRLEEALTHYEALATGPNAQVYSNAARLIRERAFRKP